MPSNKVSTYTVDICIAGDAADATRICRQFCMDKGFCVTVTPTTYVYTGGAEAGVIVRCINYPRFPSENAELWNKTLILADKLRAGLCQHSYTMIAPDRTLWVSERDE